MISQNMTAQNPHDIAMIADQTRSNGWSYVARRLSGCLVMVMSGCPCFVGAEPSSPLDDTTKSNDMVAPRHVLHQ
jgi:hypothetical protein